MFIILVIVCVMLDVDGKGEFFWQKSFCNFKMVNVI